jgi:hypothetical protein
MSTAAKKRYADYVALWAPVPAKDRPGYTVVDGRLVRVKR